MKITNAKVIIQNTDVFSQGSKLNSVLRETGVTGEIGRDAAAVIPAGTGVAEATAVGTRVVAGGTGLGREAGGAGTGLGGSGMLNTFLQRASASQ